MEINEFIAYRNDLLKDSSDDEGFVQQNLFLSEVLPLMSDAKLIDTEDCNESYYVYPDENLKINGYTVNESGERLQLFIVDENSIDLKIHEDDLKISTRAHYENQFKRVTRFINKAIKGYLNDELQDSSPVRALVSQLSSSEGADQFDVIEIFLISATATIESRGATPQPRRFDFDDEKLAITFSKNREKKSKDILILRKLIDLNFLYGVIISQGNREALVIDFEKTFDFKIEVIKAADEENFESYLCVLPASILADLYKRYSSRLLEKNVRSFLQFKGANFGIRETIRLSPERFIAFNNGITITSTGKEIKEENGKLYIKSLTDFQIVNGGQTTASIFFTRKDGYAIDKVKVMAKINVAKNVSEEGLDDLISKISRYSNSQTKVSTVDLGSRNPQLNKIKALSDSVLTPTGRKWFFEKSKGEFNTRLRIAGSNKGRIEKEYPKEMRFSKEQLGKYFTSWGDQPYVVKKGGDKVFKYFIDALSGDETEKGKIDIDRNFYEMLIARVILFKGLENIYGQGSKSFGQLRSAVVPYSISVIYKYTDGVRGGKPFDLARLWQKESFEEDFAGFAAELMSLMNELVKSYSPSDDPGEYSRRKDLWDNISDSAELKEFMSSPDAVKTLNKYTVSKEILKERAGKRKKFKTVDFSLLNQNATIFSRKADFYKKLGLLVADTISVAQRNKIDHLINCIVNKNDISAEHALFESQLIQEIRAEKPELFDSILVEPDNQWLASLKLVVELYNKCIDQSQDILSEFQKQREIAKLRGAKFYSVYDEIGKSLQDGKAPSIRHLYSLNNLINIVGAE